jgi:chromosome segregation ATPase
MKTFKLTVMMMTVLSLTGTVGAATPEAAAPDAKPAPSWQALADTAQEIAITRFSPDDLAAQIEKKDDRLNALYRQQSALEAQIVTVIDASGTALAEIEAIDDPVLRDESLLRFRATKNTRLKTVQATLAAVNDAIAREQRELATLRRVLQGRKAEARLYGETNQLPSSYLAYLSSEAARVRTSEADILRRVREQRVARLQQAVLPLCGPRVPGLTDVVMTVAREK